MVHLDQTWNVFLPHKVGVEESEGVRRVGIYDGTVRRGDQTIM